MSLPRIVKSLVSSVLALLVLEGGVHGKMITPYREIPNDEKRVALTFDDGPHKKYTEQILDILDQYGVKCTFFVIGKNCVEHPEILSEIAKRGHEIGNHTYSHPDVSHLGMDELMLEIIKTENTIYELCEYSTRLFRPPGGIYSHTVSNALERLDYLPILWTVDTKDWRHLSSEKIINNVIENVESGSIILCHDYISGQSNTAEALKTIIPALIEQGYEFVTVGELTEGHLTGK